MFTVTQQSMYEHYVLGYHTNLREVGLAEEPTCAHGCKIYECECGHRQVIHNPAYGCKEG
jgi:hypothetical protein